MLFGYCLIDCTYNFNPRFFAVRIAVYKAMYPTVGTLADVIAAIDQVRTQLIGCIFFFFFFLGSLVKFMPICMHVQWPRATANYKIASFNFSHAFIRSLLL